MMFLYAALTALLCISFSSGFTTPLLPEIEETTPTSETTQTLEIHTSEIQILETTQTETTQTSETTQAETTQTETTQTKTTQTETTQTSETTQAETTQAETAQTETTQTETTQTLETTQPPSVFIQKSGQQCTYAGRASDVLEIGCWGYKRCVEGELVTYWCTHNTVLERDSMTCVRPGKGNTGCSLAISCRDKPNGFFADWGSKCQTYYQCHEGVKYANMYCSATLVFNEAIQSCDYKRNVVAPCGTLVLQ